VAGNRPVDITARNACRLLDAAGRRDVPVYAGGARPIAHSQPRCNEVHGTDGLGGVDLPLQREPEREHAANFLVRTLSEAPEGSVALVAVGPLTNLALAELLHPGLLRRVRSLHVMGGAVFRRGNITPQAEFNFYADPLAAEIVLQAGVTVQLFGLDVTSQASMPPAWIESLGRMGKRCTTAAHAMLTAYASRERVLHDACPVAHLLQPSLFHAETHRVSVVCQPGEAEGRSVPQPVEDGKPNAWVHMRVDNAGLMALLQQRLAALP
jgi:purine nucleosidase